MKTIIKTDISCIHAQKALPKSIENKYKFHTVSLKTSHQKQSNSQDILNDHIRRVTIKVEI